MGVSPGDKHGNSSGEIFWRYRLVSGPTYSLS